MENESWVERALQPLERELKLSVSLHDMRGALRSPDGGPLLGGRCLHRHPCCLVGRYVESGWDARCLQDCLVASEGRAAALGEPFVKRCWKGLGELVVPVLRGGEHLLTIYAGVFRTPGSEGLFPREEPEEVRELFLALPELDESWLLSLGETLTLFGLGLVERARSCRGAEGEGHGRAADIRRFIDDNAHRRVGLTDLARRLHLSPSRAGHVVKEDTGSTFQELLLRERMLRARNLLRSSRGTLEETSLRLGFKNGFYFCRVFAQFHDGMPPGEYRRRHVDKTVGAMYSAL